MSPESAKDGMFDIGFVGIGMMGLPMAMNLLKGRPEVRLHVVSGRAKTNLRRLRPANRVVRHRRLDELAAAVRVCFTMLPMPADIEQVVLGGGGDTGDCLLAGLRPRSVVVDCSTSSAKLARGMDERLREIGCAAVDAPVSGSPVRAESGTLSLMVGADTKIYRRVRGLLEHLGTPTLIGPPGSGQITKSINQIIVGLTAAAISEGILLGRRAGIDLDAMLQAVGGGLAGSEFLRLKGPNMVRNRFKPGFYLRYHLKDLNLALETAAELGLSLPMTAMVRELLRMAVAQGRGSDDHSAILAALTAVNEPIPGR